MFVQFNQVSYDNRCKIIDFFGIKNLVQERPNGMYTLDFILGDNVSIGSDDNRIKFIKQINKKEAEELILEPIHYRKITIY